MSSFARESGCSAMILAAGFGTRLRPLTATRAKAVVPFLNAPLLDHSLDWLQRCGFEEVVINLHHLPETVVETYRDHGFDLQIHFNVEPSILGTAGGPRAVLERLGERVLIVNGDIAARLPLGPLWQRHRDSGALATLALHAGPAAAEHPLIELDAEGRITRIPGVGGETADREGRGGDGGDAGESGVLDNRSGGDGDGSDKLGGAGGGAPAGCFTGIHIVEREVLETVPEGRFCGIVDPVYGALLGQGLPVCGVVVPGPWYEIGTADRYRDAQLEALRREQLPGAYDRCRRLARGGYTRGRVVWTRAGLRPPFFLDEGVRIEKGALVEGVVAGARAHVGSGADVRESVLQARAWVGAGARLERCVVMEDAVVPAGARLIDQVVAPAAVERAG
jgi:NDP-sugar pyrophosphorylase family protein